MPRPTRLLLALAPALTLAPLTAQVTQRVNVSSAGAQASGTSLNQPEISDDGRFVVFQSTAPDLVPGDTNAATDVFVRDRVLGTTVRASVSSSGAQGSGNSEGPCVSGDGRYVAFHSVAADLAPGDTNGVQDAFVRDLAAGTTERVSIDSAGAQ